jgi:hypothetical protein
MRDQYWLLPDWDGPLGDGSWVPGHDFRPGAWELPGGQAGLALAGAELVTGDDTGPGGIWSAGPPSPEVTAWLHDDTPGTSTPHASTGPAGTGGSSAAATGQDPASTGQDPASTEPPRSDLVGLRRDGLDGGSTGRLAGGGLPGAISAGMKVKGISQAEQDQLDEELGWLGKINPYRPGSGQQPAGDPQEFTENCWLAAIAAVITLQTEEPYQAGGAGLAHKNNLLRFTEFEPDSFPGYQQALAAFADAAAGRPGTPKGPDPGQGPACALLRAAGTTTEPSHAYTLTIIDGLGLVILDPAAATIHLPRTNPQTAP